jgi:hypothetical protein
MATLFPPTVAKAGKIDCRVGFDCAKKEHRVRSSESDDSSNERLTPPHVFVESPIKKMLLNELIREHEKELQREEKSSANLDAAAGKTTTRRNLDRTKKLKIFNDDDDETEDEEHLATQRSTSSSDACSVNLSFHHNFSDPIPIPVADLQLRCALRDGNSSTPLFPLALSLLR